MKIMKVALIVMAALIFFPELTDAQELMRLEEVEARIDASPNKEVDAYFVSVPRGIIQKRYNITLRGVLRQPGLKIITFVTSEKIVAGMSGSPVYLEGKIIGAMGYSVGSFNFSDYSWGGISPISLMLEDAGSSEGFINNTARPFTYNGMLFEPIAVGHQFLPGFESLAGAKFIITKRSSTQTQTSNTANAVTIEAGMPIVVDLLEWKDDKGEITTLSSMGTITYVNDGRVFAFGHPFLNTKKSIYAFRTAEVMGTVFSEANSFKLTGKTSDILGVITKDSTYGIYGRIGVDDLDETLNHFTLDFKREGQLFKSFDIQISDSIQTPTLADAAFAMIGQINGAPLPQENSTTQLETRIELEGHNPIVWRDLFTSNSSRFGPQTIYTSSYSAAHNSFFSNLYSDLFNNDFGLKITNVYVSANFMSRSSRIYKVADYKFPNKVVFGQNPVFEISLVDQANSMPIAIRLTIQIDWDKVERPIYGQDVMDTDKISEKKIMGSFSVYSASYFYNTIVNLISNEERQTFRPDYYLGVEDYLENTSRILESTKQKIIIRVSLKQRSDLSEESVENDEGDNLIPAEVFSNENEWVVIDGGLKNRKTNRREGPVVTYPELPLLPDGSILDQGTNVNITFEVVLEN